MAKSDSTVPHNWAGGGTVVWNDGGANSLTATFEQGTLSWTESGRAYTEAMSRERHESTPVLIETGDSNVSGTLTVLVTSFYGSAAVMPYEFVRFAGGAAAYTSTATGSKKAFEMVVTMTNDDAATQTATFAYCVAGEIGIDLAATDGLTTMTIPFTDHENAPTIA